MSKAVKIDRYDIAILRELQINGRITKTKLAERVNLSPSPCWERLKKLEDAGLITGYRAMVDIRAIAPVTEVLVEITLVGHKSDDFRLFETAIRDAPQVQACWATGGGIDYIMRVVVSDVDAYQRLMDDLLDRNVGIERYFGYIVTKSVKNVPDPLP
ncbi:Lrp/AsnC family transcriptional regulator [Thalassovita sp.]|uniref:Lrp/AsnC family transcriptional regulator n=1 Tax=Thalassovita sp. TaxID=1979401 RepID=UPI002B27B486|nr:Lrp/AsnC family transcriptional regulator [Thalassovita sp.]